MSGGSKKQTVGYWYRPTWEAVVCAGPVDAIRRFEAGGQPAWQGRQDASGTITIDESELWGGESSEGGIKGSLVVRMGDAAQAAGGDGQKHQGVLTLRWPGGRFGAMNPYPKSFAALVERVLKGWDQDDPWYPAKAPIPIGGTVLSGLAALSNTPAIGGSGGGGSWGAGGGVWGPDYLDYRPDVFSSAFLLMFSFDLSVSGAGPHTIYAEVGGSEIWSKSLSWAPGEMTKLISVQLNAPVGHVGVRLGFRGAMTGSFNLLLHAIVDPTAWHSILPGQSIVESDDPAFGIVTDGAGNYRSVHAVYSLTPIWSTQDSYVSPDALLGMNPAHLIYYTLVSPTMQGEPSQLIDEDSFEDAADLFYAEGLGVCTLWDPDQETAEALRERICDSAGAACTRSPRDGKWYLRPIRGAGDPAGLPTLTDDDILDIELEPGVLDDAVNQVSVRWRDPVTHQDRTTAPIHALGAIDQAGVNAQTLDYLALPTEDLALRTAERELRARATPLTRLTLTCTRKPYAWLRGEYFKVQAPKNGIANMVCMVGDIDRGTLQSGAIKIVALQDVYTLPATSYVQAQPAIDSANAVPVAVTDAALMEVPYAALVPQMSAAELAALADDAGYLLTVGPRPADGLVNYQLQTRPAAGSYAEAGTFDWCPAATIVEASASGLETGFNLTGGVLLDRVELGSVALWGSEIVRVDTLDTGTGSITLGRGCWDTVPQPHAAGARIFFFGGGWYGSDLVEYVDGETVNAKLLSRSGTGVLALGAAPELSLVLDGRAARPYPPGNLLINGQGAPSTVEGGMLSLSWAHRDRQAQADQVVDTTAGSIGPEAGTVYNARLYNDDTNALLTQALGVSGTGATMMVPGGIAARLEVEAVRGGLASWQRHVRRLASMDGLLLFEDGNIVTDEGSSAWIFPEDAAQDSSDLVLRASVVLGGTHHSNEQLGFAVTLSDGATRYFYATAQGTTTLAAFANAVAVEFRANGIHAAAIGTTVRVYGDSGITGIKVRSTWPREIDPWTVQAASAPAAGGAQRTFVDLYTDAALSSLCPSTSSAFAAPGLPDVRIVVGKRFYTAAAVTGGTPFVGRYDSGGTWFPGQDGDRQFQFIWPAGGGHGDYLYQLGLLADQINGSADMTANGIAAAVSTLAAPPTPDLPMTRAALVITASGDHAIRINGAPGAPHHMAEGYHHSGYKWGIAQWADPGPALPLGLAQISALDPRRSAGQAGHEAGQQLWLEIAGTEYQYTFTGAEMDGEDVAVGLAALVDPGGSWTVTWRDPDVLITAMAANAPFTCSAWASWGVRVTVSIED